MYRTMRRNQIEYSANDVWAASAKAYLMNGKTYIKAHVTVKYDSDGKAYDVTPNRDVMKQLLEDNLKGVDATTKNSRCAMCVNTIKPSHSKSLQGRWMSDFDKAAMASRRQRHNYRYERLRHDRKSSKSHMTVLLVKKGSRGPNCFGV